MFSRYLQYTEYDSFCSVPELFRILHRAPPSDIEMLFADFRIFYQNKYVIIFGEILFIFHVLKH